MKYVSLAATLLLGLSLPLTHCATSTPDGETSTPHVLKQGVTRFPGCRQGDIDEGLVDITGEVVRTKGAQIILGGVILGQAGQSLAEALLGKHVTVRGRRCVYACHPQEQCLAAGQVPYLSSLIIVNQPQGRPNTRALKAPHRGPLDLGD